MKNIEQKLIKMMHRYEEELYYSAINFEPHKLTTYLENLAALFHKKNERLRAKTGIKREDRKKSSSKDSWNLAGRSEAIRVRRGW